MITAIVGSGGKTTLIHNLASEYHRAGKKVLILTTTHMFKEADTLLTDDADEIIRHLSQSGYVMAGISAGEKISCLSAKTYEKVCNYADEILIEADGSKGLPLKFPNSTEPVIPDNTDRIIIVCGLAGLNHKAKDVIHRLDEAEKHIKITAETHVTHEIIQELIQKGYIDRFMEQYPGKKIEIYPTHDNSIYQRAVASLLKANMDTSIIDKDWFAPKPCLFICGAGHVAKELAEFAAKLDFKIVIFDSRAEFANSERFPFAEKIICDSFDNLEKYLYDDAYYAVVTPGHQDDYQSVKTILNTNYRYLGMIGSRSKKAKTYSRLKDDGITDAQLETIHAPIGLPIGAATPAEIAVSILAEIIQIKNVRAFSSASAELLCSDKSGMLCIIIDKTGSAPRGIGSMMLITPTEQIDTIGGGAIENAVINDARNNSGTVFIKEYHLSETDSSKLGMICGGTNKVLFIPV